jgi:glucosamine--fructose-6-phosphate aminotransferase (isomerizing)
LPVRKSASLRPALYLPACCDASPALRAGVERGHISADEERALTKQLAEAPRLASQIIKLEDQIEKVA